MYSYQKLRAKIVEKYGSMREFHNKCEDELELSYVSMSDKMRGASGFSQKDIEKWSKLLDISTEEIGLYFFS